MGNIIQNTKLAKCRIHCSGAFFICLWIFCLYIIWWKHNYIQMDFGGHIASAVSFSRGLWHQFDDGSFLGYIHGLFYPPLEDLLISIFSIFGVLDFVVGAKIFLSVVTFFYFHSFWRIVRGIKSTIGIILFHYLFLILFFMQKPGTLYFQGLGFTDLFVTGLSSQFLGAIFFFYFVAEFLNRRRSFVLFLTVALTLASHIVMGLVMLGMILLLSLESREKKVTLPLILGVLINAFYILPFAYYSDYVAKTNILFEYNIGFYIVSILGLILSLNYKYVRLLFIGSFGLFSPLFLAVPLEKLGISIPAFHYYRFSSSAIILLVIGSAFLISRPFKEKWKNVVHILYMSLFIFIIHGHISVKKIKLNHESFKNSQLKIVSDPITMSDKFKRTWVIQDKRTSDFGMESWLKTQKDNLLFVKGLYWESSYNNIHLTSYLSTTLAPPVVLDYFYFYGHSCEKQKCLMDQFFSDYNIGSIVIQDSFSIPYINYAKALCIKRIILNEGTASYRFIPKGKIRYNNKTFTNYQLTSNDKKSKSAFNNNVLELQRFKNLRVFDINEKKYFHEPLKTTSGMCKDYSLENHPLFADKSELSKIERMLNDQNYKEPKGIPKMRFSKINSGKYRINIKSKEEQLFRIKLNYYPGFELISNDGVKLPLYKAHASMLGFGKGKMYLVFKRIWVFYLGYFISLATTLFIFVFRKRLFR